MDSVKSQTLNSIEYPNRTVERAQKAICCAPFQLHLYQAMQNDSVPLNAIVGNAGTEKGYTRSPLPDLTAESGLLWLIQVGVLRREVDGQGITDRFRLTPLGRQLVEKFQQQGDRLSPPSWCDRIENGVNRWLRLPL